MRALTWHGRREVSVDTVPDPAIIEPTDAIIRVTSTAICGSDLHLYELLGPFLSEGDVLGHEAMGIVEDVGADVSTVAVGDRVVVPFVIACGECFMCQRGLQTQCETTQVREKGSGATLYGYTELYGSVPGGQAEYLRVLRADANCVVVPHNAPDERYLFLSDILPTAWQGVEYAGVAPGDSVAVLGLGPVGQFASRIARERGCEVIGVDPVPERRAMAERNCVRAIDVHDEIVDELRDATDGRGPAAVIDAVGMEAHGSPFAAGAQTLVGTLPDAVAKPAMMHAGIDRLAALHTAIAAVRRGGTLSLSGVYAGAADPLPMLTMFDRQLTVRMGQCNVHSWVDALMPFAGDPGDPLGIDDLVTHRAGLDEAPALYETFQKKQDGCVKVVLKPQEG
ncbi:alcohol dehydrogenase catalytic domain-containing protein [Paramicrobacterium agarici]|uniref:alcohol dehydrogenase catalytic domain-containing protein n=1 Tax=Paramicrobacterium agarici TaxID=630514 RepID=UPI001151BC33|nr:alcohol dehydrogenase catalytic domain-containing protein [Microbacterium agarici]TQO24187.1 threonine dehydrogenase-like Zn-dependent dehydrogenase [Microbacterium agarici]